MYIKGLVDEDFVNYKEPSMFIIFPSCTFKCEEESGVVCCQNSNLAFSPLIEIHTDEIVRRYVMNPITSAIVFGGLEPFDTDCVDLLTLVESIRKATLDPIVIYTGYTEEELACMPSYTMIKFHENIIVKFGRFVPNQPHHFDNILGVELASPNQYAKKIS